MHFWTLGFHWTRTTVTEMWLRKVHMMNLRIWGKRTLLNALSGGSSNLWFYAYEFFLQYFSKLMLGCVPAFIKTFFFTHGLRVCERGVLLTEVGNFPRLLGVCSSHFCVVLLKRKPQILIAADSNWQYGYTGCNRVWCTKQSSTRAGLSHEIRAKSCLPYINLLKSMFEGIMWLGSAPSTYSESWIRWIINGGFLHRDTGSSFDPSEINGKNSCWD